MSLLSAFNNQLIRFFEELIDSYPEERELKLGLETIQGAKKINPKLILDMFYEHVYKDAHDFIEKEDENSLRTFAHAKVSSEFNEMSSALLIFDKYWLSMSENNRVAIWKYLKVLCALCMKAKAATGRF
jgi:GTP1/Obg family GTP-binding protein